MKQSIGLVSLLVRDYDEALAFYVGVLGFALVQDTPVPEQNKRWVVVAPPGATESSLLLARASSLEQVARVGNQTGGRVFLFLNTDNLARDYASFKSGKGDHRHTIDTEGRYRFTSLDRLFADFERDVRRIFDEDSHT